MCVCNDECQIGVGFFHSALNCYDIRRSCGIYSLIFLLRHTNWRSARRCELVSAALITYFCAVLVSLSSAYAAIPDQERAVE